MEKIPATCNAIFLNERGEAFYYLTLQTPKGYTFVKF